MALVAVLWWVDIVWSGASWGRLLLAIVTTLVTIVLLLRRFYWTQTVRFLASRRNQRR
jgi:hypothetical protein